MRRDLDYAPTPPDMQSLRRTALDCYHALMRTIYLDHNATTPLLPEAASAMLSLGTEIFGNPSSPHQIGRKARQRLEDAREAIAARLGAAPDEVIFTSGATEANNLALFGLAGPPGGHLLAAPIEHPCVVEPLKTLANRGYDVEWLPVNESGSVTTASVRERIRPETRLISLMLVNHETGAEQPVRHVAKISPKTIAIHCDAAQAIGKRPVDFHDLCVTTLSASAHKFRGPKGVGLLLVKRGTVLAPHLLGGPQQRGFRPGTESVPLIVGMRIALDHALDHLDDHTQTVTRLRDLFWQVVSEGLPGVEVNGPAPGAGLPHTLNLSFPGVRADVLLMRLDLAGIACSTGAACSSGSLLPSPGLAALGLDEDRRRGAIRFSFGPTLTDEEVSTAAQRIVEAIRGLSRSEPPVRANPKI